MTHQEFAERIIAMQENLYRLTLVGIPLPGQLTRSPVHSPRDQRSRRYDAGNQRK